jgi:hypothetical protein
MTAQGFECAKLRLDHRVGHFAENVLFIAESVANDARADAGRHD